MKPSPTGSRRRFVARRLLPLSPFVFVAGAALWNPADVSAAVPLAQHVTATGRVALPGSVHPWIDRGIDMGRLDPARHLTGISLLFKPTATQKELAATTLATLQDPTSAGYHQWLSPEEYAAKFGASPADVARASAWLSSQGLWVDGASRTATRLSFSGSVGDLERAFATEMHVYSVDGAEHFAMSVAPSVPADLQQLVLGVHGAHSFRIPSPTHGTLKPLYSFPYPLDDGGTVNVASLAPADFSAIYNTAGLFAKGITGKGQKLVVAEQTDFNDADITTFRSTFNLSTNPPVRVLVPNSGNSVVSAGDLGEAELDAEWAGAVAPDATIEYVYTGDTDNNGVFDALIYAVEQDTAPLISISYGSCEAGTPPSDAVYYELLGDSAAMMGITVLAASGDTGAAGCDSQFSTAARHGEYVGLPASVPSVIAVGGTQFQLDELNPGTTYLDGTLNAHGYIPESGWNETYADEDAGFAGLGASTGGVSVTFAKPFWQVPFTPKDGFRDVPDVALSASAEIMPYITAGSWTAADGDAQAPQAESLSPTGGTSAAAPSFAAILALVNQSIAAAHPDAPVGLGNANPILYALANNATGKAAFHDVTTGDNIVPCMAASPSCPTTGTMAFGYSCGPGYDQVTGLGSVDATALATAWSTLVPTAITLKATVSGTTEGSPLELDATVASTATLNALGGDVIFYFETFDAQGNIDLGGSLGQVAVTPSTSGPEGGTASLKTIAPSGLTGSAKIGAFYSGDVNYLASWSALSAISSKPTLAICPTAATMAPGQTGLTFTTTGGAPPVSLSIGDDSTCMRVNHAFVCSSFDDAGVFTAGPTTGTAQVVALDSAEAYVTATVTVQGAADSGAPLPVFTCGPDAGGSSSDAGLDATTDASGATVKTDGGPVNEPVDAGPVNEPTKGSCGCITAGQPSNLAGAGWGGLLFGLVALAWRRRR